MDVPSSALSLLESYRERIKILEKRLERLNRFEVGVLDDNVTLIKDDKRMFFDGDSEFNVTRCNEVIYEGGDWDEALNLLLKS